VIKYSTETPKIQKKKRVNTLRYNNLSLQKGSRKFLIGGSYELLLEAGYLDYLWLVTT
jgi:hypothetical protein